MVRFEETPENFPGAEGGCATRLSIINEIHLAQAPLLCHVPGSGR